MSTDCFKDAKIAVNDNNCRNPYIKWNTIGRENVVIYIGTKQKNLDARKTVLCPDKKYGNGQQME